MNKKFAYSILRYHHSKFLGEVFNVGLLFVFPDENVVIFHYPKKLNRISGLYAEFNEQVIKDYLRAFEKRASQLGKELDKYVFGYKELITDNLIVENSAALQFTDFRIAQYQTSIEEVTDLYYKLYLGDYQSEAIKSKHTIDEKYIVNHLKSEVLELNPKAAELIKYDNQRILKSKYVQFKSDFYWKNGVVNYAKVISFDLATEEGIINKSFLLNGQLRQLEKTSYSENHIDFVIYQPENSKFKDTIEEALYIVEYENQIQKRFFAHWSDYSREIAENITPIEY